MNKLKRETGLHTERAQQVGALFAKFRKKAGLTMREVGELIDTSHTTIDKIEKAQRDLTLLEFIHICQTLKLSEVEVFKQVSKIYHDNPEPV